MLAELPLEARHIALQGQSSNARGVADAEQLHYAVQLLPQQADLHHA
ncbi:hypothetical protein [Roseococcus sp.]